MNEAIGVSLAAALLGAAWRRYLGSGYGSRALKLSVGFLLFLLVATYATQHWLHGLIVAGMLLIGFADGAVFEPQKPLIYRYGFVTMAIALVLVYFWHEAWFYAPLGCLVYLGYRLPKIVADHWAPGLCWTCVAEALTGAVILGPLPLLRLV
mgnify:CR=1 FL=1